jgi:predicted ester cyclase
MATTAPPTHSDPNLALMHRTVKEVHQDGNLALLNEVCHPDFINHTPTPPLPADLSGIHTIMKLIQGAFSNIEYVIEHCVHQDGVVATNKCMYGDLTGDFMGMPPDGKRKRVRIMDFVTVVGGKMKEHWANVGPIEDAPVSK